MYNELVERLRAGIYTVGELSIIIPKAADAIEELNVVVRAQKAVLDKFPRWIPVTERLPDKEENVLVCLNGCISLVAFSPKHLQFNNYDILPYDRNNRFDDVKYWMPLPEPPKEGK